MGKMKANKKFIDGEEEAVSAVIGVILMVAITVAIAATVYVYVSGMIGGTAQKASTISMNQYDKDDPSDTIVWLVAGLEGEAVAIGSYSWSLLNDNGANVTTATLTLNDNDNNSYVNPGDTFSVDAGADGYYTFLLTDSSTGATVFKSTMTKY